MLAATVETIGANWSEMACSGGLLRHQPAQAAQAHIQGIASIRPAAAEDQGMGQGSIVVTEHILEPGPFIATGLMEGRQQLFGEGIAHQIDGAIATELAQILMDGLESKGPGPWAGCFGDRRQGQLEEIHCPVAQVVAAGAAHTGGQGQQGAPQTIIGAIGIEPGALEAHKIMKTADFWDIGIVNKRCIIGGQRLNLWGNVTRFFEHYQQLQGTHIVIGAISFLEVGEGIFGVLVDTCGICYPFKMLQP